VARPNFRFLRQPINGALIDAGEFTVEPFTEGDITWNMTYVRFDSTNTDNPEAVAHEGNPIKVCKNFTTPPEPPA